MMSGKRWVRVILIGCAVALMFAQSALAANRTSPASIQRILHKFQNGMTARQVAEAMADPLVHEDETDGALVFFDQPETDATMMAKFQGDVISNLVFRWPYLAGDMVSLKNGYATLKVELSDYFGREPDVQHEEYQDGLEADVYFLDGAAAWKNVYGGNAIILATHKEDILELSLMCSGFASAEAAPEETQQPQLRNMTDEEVNMLSLDELVTLKNQLNLAIWRATEWKQVTLQQGVWQVGKDIPAGHYTIQASNGAYTLLQWCGRLNDDGVAMDVETLISTVSLVSIHSKMFDSTMHRSTIDWNLKDGTYIIVSSGSAVFFPYRGNADFEFAN